MRLWHVQYLRKCAGLPPGPAARTMPNIALVNRGIMDGRSILGIDQVYWDLKMSHPDLEISMVNLNGANFSRQVGM